MTEPASLPATPATPRAEAQGGRRPPRRRPRALPTVLAALACFGVAFEFLAFQLGAGNDPALGGTPAIATQQAKAGPVKKRIVITKVVGGSAGGSTGGAAVASSSAPAAAPAPVTTATS